jgi:hypothetical protein
MASVFESHAAKVREYLEYAPVAPAPLELFTHFIHFQGHKIEVHSRTYSAEWGQDWTVNGLEDLLAVLDKIEAIESQQAVARSHLVWLRQRVNKSGNYVAWMLVTVLSGVAAVVSLAVAIFARTLH